MDKGFEKVILKCIGKIRDKNGNIIGYKLATRDNKHTIIEPEILKRHIIENIATVVNLKLTSDGRLIDSKIEEFNQNNCNKLYVNHTPKFNLTYQHMEYIKEYGLAHVISAQFVDATKQHGLLTKWSKPMKPCEKNMIWFYLNSDEVLQYIDHSVGGGKTPHRPKNKDDAYKVVFFPTEEEMKKMKFRPIGNGLVQKFSQIAYVVDWDIKPDRIKIEKMFK